MTKQSLKIRGLKVPPSIILYNFIEDKRIRDNFNTSFELWGNKLDQERDLSNFDLDLCIIPSNLSASLFNRGYPIKLLSINIWGILHLMSKKYEVISWNSFNKKKIAIPLKGNMPDTIFKVLIDKNINSEFNSEIIYCESYDEAKKKLMNNNVDYAVLPEPYASLAEFNGANRLLNLQQEWGKTFNSEPRYPQAGAVVNNRFSQKHFKLFLDVLISSTKKIYEEPNKASIVGEKLLGIDKNVILNSFKHSNIETISASNAFVEIKNFFKILNNVFEASPDLNTPSKKFIAL